MSSRLFGTTSDYARFSGTPPVTATPLTMLVAAQTSSFAANSTIMCIAASGGTDTFRIGHNTTGAGHFAAQTATAATGNTTNFATVDVPFIVIGREVAVADHDAILNGDLANAGNSTTSRAPASLNRITFGKRDSSENSNPFAGVVFYGALWNVALSDEEVVALGLHWAPPTLIRPSALVGYWPNFGRSDGTTIIDITGRSPLTITGGSNSDIAARRVTTRGVRVGRGSAVTVTGTGAGNIAPLVGAASGVHGVTGTAAGLVAPLVGAASGVHGVTGTAAGLIAPLVGAASGVHGVVGTAAGLVAPLVGAASGTHTPYIGTGAGNIAPLVGAATGAHGVAGTAAGTIAPLVGAATGAHGVAGTGTGLIAPLVGAASGVHGVTGTGAGQIAPLVGAASGIHSVSGTGAGLIAPLVGAATGVHGVTGTGAGQIAPLVGAAVGTHSDPGAVAGAGAGFIAPLVGDAVGVHGVAGTGAGQIAPLVGLASGVHGVVGTGEGFIAPLVGFGVGTFGDVEPEPEPVPVARRPVGGIARKRRWFYRLELEASVECRADVRGELTLVSEPAPEAVEAPAAAPVAAAAPSWSQVEMAAQVDLSAGLAAGDLATIIRMRPLELTNVISRRTRDDEAMVLLLAA